VSDEDAEGIIKHPDMYQYVGDDSSVPVDEYKIPQYWVNVVAYRDGIPAGFLLVSGLNMVTAEVHVGIHPDHRDISKECGVKLVQWVWDNLTPLKLVGQSHAKVVTDYAVSCGFKVEGINEGSFMKNGELIDQTYIGIKKWQQQSQA